MKQKIIYFLSISTIVLFMNSCIKTEFKPQGDAGATYLKIVEAPENQLFFSPFSDVKSIDLFSVRKDANSSTSLNTVSKATLTSLPALIDTFNENNGTTFELLPDSLFTLTNAAVTKTPTGYLVDFQSGKFANEFTIGLNGSKWDVSHTYALAFKLSGGDGNIASSGLDTIIVFLSVKNKYDGKYTSIGTLTDVVVPTITAFSPWECEFHTSGPNSIQIYDPYFGAVYHAIASGGSRSVYGAFGPEITFDPVTNDVVSITNIYAPAANTRNALMDNTKTYTWDEATKTLSIKFYMTQPSLVPAAPSIRTTFIETFKYTGPR